MRKYLPALLVVAALYVGWGQFNRTHDVPTQPATDNAGPANAPRESRSGDRITGEGVVYKVLADDNDGSRHQRFILRLASGQTLLIAHNIDLAPKIESLEPGDTVAFNGVYESNARGGVVHWTHRDPNGRHPAGWLKHNGKTFQ